jgi:hypothetical protein
MAKTDRAAYGDTIVTLRARILALIPEHPEIMDMEDPWRLFKVPGFRSDDLGPSLAQASGALASAQHIYRERMRHGETD